MQRTVKVKLCYTPCCAPSAVLMVADLQLIHCSLALVLMIRLVCN